METHQKINEFLNELVVDPSMFDGDTRVLLCKISELVNRVEDKIVRTMSVVNKALCEGRYLIAGLLSVKRAMPDTTPGVPPMEELEEKEKILDGGHKELFEIPSHLSSLYPLAAFKAEWKKMMKNESTEGSS